MSRIQFPSYAPALSLALALTLSVSADDWPHWRGPNHNGISQETDWWQEGVAHEPNIIWERQLGVGYASLTVADGRLFAMGSVDGIEGQRTLQDHDVLYCLDPNSGKTFWTHAYATPRYDDNFHEGGPCATPTVANGQVYTLSKYGVAYCFDANDGVLFWERDLKGDFNLRRPNWQFSGSPFVEGERVIYNVGTHGLALDANDGSLAWSTGSGECGHATPVPFIWQDKRLLLISGDEMIAAVDPNTGAVAWTLPWKNRIGSVPNITDPIVDGNNIYVSEGYSTGSAMYTVTESGPQELWFQKNLQTFLGTAVLWEQFLYAANDRGDTLTSLDTWDGYIMWTHRGDYRHAHLMLADGKLITLSDRGELAIVAANPDRYQELGRWSILQGDCWTMPVLANGKIYARNAQGRLVCVELQPVGGRSGVRP